MDVAIRFADVLRKLQAARLAEAEALGDLAAVLSSGGSAPLPLLAAATSQMNGEPCYLSAKQLAERIPYTEASIRNMVSSGELVEGRHYFKRRRRIMFSWQAMREWVEQQSIAETAPLPLVRNRRNGHPE